MNVFFMKNVDDDNFFSQSFQVHYHLLSAHCSIHSLRSTKTCSLG